MLQKDGLLSSNDDILYESLLLGPIGKRIPREINQWFVLQDYFDTKSQPTIDYSVSLVFIDHNFEIIPPWIGSFDLHLSK